MANVAAPRGRPRLAILTDETLDENLRQLQPDRDAPTDSRSVSVIPERWPNPSVPSSEPGVV